MYSRVPNCMIATLEQFFSFTLHDAQLYNIQIDYAHQTISMDVACMHSLRDGAGEVLLEEYRRGRLELQGLEYVFFDGDDAAGLEVFDSPETISEFLAEDPDWEGDLSAAKHPDAGVTAYRLYFFSWNCFLHLGVREAAFRWTEPPRFSAWHILEVISRLRARIADDANSLLQKDPTWLG